MLTRLFLVALVLLCPASVRAQGVPFVAVDLARGDGRHTMQTAHVYYGDNPTSFLRAVATIRVGNEGVVRPIAVLEVDSDCGFIDVCGDLANCGITPNGGCYQRFADPIGSAAGVGVAGTFGSHLLGAVTVGGARGAKRVRYVDASATIRIVPDLGAMVGVRRIVWNDAYGDRTWFVPIFVGFRVY